MKAAMEHQSTFFFAHEGPMLAALSALDGKNACPDGYAAFVREVGAITSRSAAGSLILVGVPNPVAEAHVRSSLEQYLETVHGKATDKPLVASLNVPFASNVRAQRRRLLDTYADFPLSRFKPPASSLSLDFCTRSNAIDPLEQISSLVRHREPRYYLVSEANLLRTAASNAAEMLGQVRFFVQLAREAQKTHVLFASIAAVCEWTNDPEIHWETEACIMRPYDPRQRSDWQEFSILLNSYEQVLPLAPGSSILRRQKQIMNAVGGCPYRLNKWIVHVLKVAIAHGRKELKWQDFEDAGPSDYDRNVAALAYSKTMKRTNKSRLKLNRAAAQGKSKAGSRALGRDDVAQEVA